jgi:hypothetical protein
MMDQGKVDVWDHPAVILTPEVEMSRSRLLAILRDQSHSVRA